MMTFLKSDLFLRFLGGFAIGAVQPDEQPILSSPAIAATSAHHAAR